MLSNNTEDFIGLIIVIMVFLTIYLVIKLNTKKHDDQEPFIIKDDEIKIQRSDEMRKRERKIFEEYFILKEVMEKIEKIKKIDLEFKKLLFFSKEEILKRYFLFSKSEYIYTPDKIDERYYADLFIRYLLEQGYPADLILREFPIQIGSMKKRADIVIFYDTERKTQDNIFMVIEIKRPDIPQHSINDAYNQLISYASACLNCRYGILVIGTEYYIFELRYINNRRDITRVFLLPPPPYML